MLLESISRLCQGLSEQAIIEASQRFASGDVKDQSKRFAPSVPEFVEEARRRQEFLDLASRPKQEYISYTPGPLAPFEISREKARQRVSGLKLIVENVTFADWQRMSAMRQVPVGARWVASLCAIYEGFEERAIESRRHNQRIATALEMLGSKNGSQKSNDELRRDFIAKYGESAFNALPDAPRSKVGTFNQAGYRKDN